MLKRLQILLILLASLLLPSLALADINKCSSANVSSTTLCNPVGADTFDKFIPNLLNGVGIFLGILVVAMLVYSGFRMIISQGNEEQVAKAKTTFQWTILGFVIIITAYIVISAISSFLNVQTINPNQTGAVQIQNPLGSVTDYKALLSLVFTGIIPVIGVIALLFIIISGFRYITARGNDEQTAHAKQGLQWSVIGLILVILAYVIVVAVSKLFNSPI